MLRIVLIMLWCETAVKRKQVIFPEERVRQDGGGEREVGVI